MGAEGGFFHCAEFVHVDQVVNARAIGALIELPDADRGGPQNALDMPGFAFFGIPARVGRGGDSVHGETADGDVVGVLIGSVGIEGED